MQSLCSKATNTVWKPSLQKANFTVRVDIRLRLDRKLEPLTVVLNLKTTSFKIYILQKKDIVN